MRTGLFFGSFNPVHIGHLIIAEHMRFVHGLEEVWFVVSPQNPFKSPDELWPENDRLAMVKLAIGANPNLIAIDAEFALPKPSYTAQTLNYLSAHYPHRDFQIIMGSDNLAQLDKWQQYEWMLSNYIFLVYYRSGFENPPLATHPNVRISEAPVLHISATFIRERLKAGGSVRYLVLPEVAEYITRNGLSAPVV